jgi:hypothetical protein
MEIFTAPGTFTKAGSCAPPGMSEGGTAMTACPARFFSNGKPKLNLP